MRALTCLRARSALSAAARPAAGRRSRSFTLRPRANERLTAFVRWLLWRMRIVADAVMDLMGVTQLEICPWALREGVILKRLDILADPATRSLTGPLPSFPT